MRGENGTPRKNGILWLFSEKTAERQYGVFFSAKKTLEGMCPDVPGRVKSAGTRGIVLWFCISDGEKSDLRFFRGSFVLRRETYFLRRDSQWS